MATAASGPQLFCIGNPLLDMSISNGESLLEKYNLKPNDAILADPEHMGIYKDIEESPGVKYVAGGAAQNAARGAAVSVVHRWIGGKPYIALPDHFRFSTFYRLGLWCIPGVLGMMISPRGYERQMPKRASKVLISSSKGRKPVPVVWSSQVIIGMFSTLLLPPRKLIASRSLVTTLRAAEKFDKAHLSDPKVVNLIENANFFYIGGFFLTHGVESATELAKAASGAGKVEITFSFLTILWLTQIYEGRRSKSIRPFRGSVL